MARGLAASCLRTYASATCLCYQPICFMLMLHASANFPGLITCPDYLWQACRRDKAVAAPPRLRNTARSHQMNVKRQIQKACPWSDQGYTKLRSIVKALSPSALLWLSEPYMRLTTEKDAAYFFREHYPQKPSKNETPSTAKRPSMRYPQSVKHMRRATEHTTPPGPR